MCIDDGVQYCHMQSNLRSFKKTEQDGENTFLSECKYMYATRYSTCKNNCRWDATPYGAHNFSISVSVIVSNQRGQMALSELSVTMK